jgi:type 1 glutamine amidotransferase
MPVPSVRNEAFAMNDRDALTRATLVALLAVCRLLSPAGAAQPKPPSPEEAEKIAAAVPARATARPGRPRKLLVFSLGKGHVHTAIPYGATALELIGRKTGAFEAVHSTDPEARRSWSLGQLDALCSNNSNRMDFFQDGALRKSVLDFVKGGKGLVGIHAETTNFAPQYKLDRPEGAELLGGISDRHPWHERGTIKLDDANHPLSAAFGGRGFAITDAIYPFRRPYSRTRLRVLLSLDTAKTVQRRDNDFAVSWVRSHGKGRVFYCSPGHDHDVFRRPDVLRHYCDSVQFALGDLSVDTTPSMPARRGLPATGAGEKE